MGLLASPWETGAAGRWVVPSEELRVALSCAALPMGGLYQGDTTGPLGREASRGGMLQMESPGRGATYSDIPPKEVLGVVTPPEEAVTP